MVVLRAENIFSQSLAGVDIMGCPKSSITQKILQNILQKILLKSYILCHLILNKYLVIR